MGPTEINGLPAHILLVHFVVVLVPLAAVLTVLSAVWPAFRQRLGILTPLAALAALIAVPITMHAGEWLEARVVSTPLIRKHTEIADGLLPWVIGIFVIALGAWAYYRFASTVKLPVSIVLAVLALVAGAGSMVQVYRIGDSGSKAVWTGSFSSQPQKGN